MRSLSIFLIALLMGFAGEILAQNNPNDYVEKPAESELLQIHYLKDEAGNNLPEIKSGALHQVEPAEEVETCYIYTNKRWIEVRNNTDGILNVDGKGRFIRNNHSDQLSKIDPDDHELSAGKSYYYRVENDALQFMVDGKTFKIILADGFNKESIKVTLKCDEDDRFCDFGDSLKIGAGKEVDFEVRREGLSTLEWIKYNSVPVEVALEINGDLYEQDCITAGSAVMRSAAPVKVGDNGGDGEDVVEIGYKYLDEDGLKEATERFYICYDRGSAGSASEISWVVVVIVLVVAFGLVGMVLFYRMQTRKRGAGVELKIPGKGELTAGAGAVKGGDANLETLANENMVLKEKNVELSRKIEELEAKGESMEAKIKEGEEAYNLLVEEKNGLVSKQSEQEGRIASMQSELENQNGLYQNALNQKDEEIFKLNSMVASIKQVTIAIFRSESEQLSSELEGLKRAVAEAAGEKSIYYITLNNAMISLSKFIELINSKDNGENWMTPEVTLDDVISDLRKQAKSGIYQKGWINIIEILNCYAGATIQLNRKFEDAGIPAGKLLRLRALSRRIVARLGIMTIVPNLLIDKFDEDEHEYENTERMITLFDEGLKPKGVEGLVFDISCVGYIDENGVTIKPKVYYFA